MYENIILIPYRNRYKQLEMFIDGCNENINNCLPNSKLVIIEQEEGQPFNRGFLLNVGFHYFKDTCKYFITHDVDILPNKNALIEFYNKQLNLGEIVAISSPEATLGGVIKIGCDTVYAINGFPNNYFGWGCEDKAFQNRADFRKCKIERYYNHKLAASTDYFNFLDFTENKCNDSVKLSLNEKILFENFKFKEDLNDNQKIEHILSSGINNVNYEIKELYKIKNVEIIKVQIA
jgi:hypothetical protein